jgi:hypothetical protein
MTQKNIFNIIALGFLAWLVPFAISCLFFKPGGELMIAHDLFKSIMIVTGSLSGCILLYYYFKSITNDFIKHGIVVGGAWFAMSVLFDVLVLIPLMKVSFDQYFQSIGLGYLVIPIISITMGCMLHQKVKIDKMIDA